MQGLRSFTARAARALAYQQQARTRISTTSTRCLSTATPYLNPDLPSLNREANSSIAACQTRTTTNYSQPQDGHSIENRTNEHRPSISTPVERLMQGRVVSTKMIRTVKVRVAQQIWNKRLQKYFGSHRDYLVHDPASSLAEGDIVSFTTRPQSMVPKQPKPAAGAAAAASAAVQSSGRKTRPARVPAWRPSKVGHIVRQILVPFGTPIDQRPAVPSLG